jgi:hypothetical protein
MPDYKEPEEALSLVMAFQFERHAFRVCKRPIVGYPE